MPLTEAGFLPEIDYTARDFDTIREALVRHLQNYFPNDWQDFAESNLGTALMELVAYVGDQLSFYLDRVANEQFLPTVTQRENALRLVNLIGFVPRTAAAAVAPLQMTLEAQATPTTISPFVVITDRNGNPWEILETIEIPAGRSDTNNIQVTSEVLGSGDGSTASFSFITDNENVTLGSASLSFTIGGTGYSITAGTDGNIVLPFGGSGFIDHLTGDITLVFAPSQVPDNNTDITITYTYDQKINVFQGRTRSDVFSSTGIANQSFTLTTTPVLLDAIVQDEFPTPNPNRLEVWIGDAGLPFGNATGQLWRRVETLVTAGPTEEVYAVRVDEDDQVIIEFGDNLAGAIPVAGASNITVIYRTGGGVAGNINIDDISTTVGGSSGFFGVTVNVRNSDRGSGGAARESLDEIRVNAPAFLRTNDTATTEDDFDTLALFSAAGQGAVTRAKSRLTPAPQVTTKTVHTNEVLGTVPTTTPLEYFLRLPATPAVVSTINVTYEVPAGTQTVTATDLGSGLAGLVGGAGTLDTVLSRLRYDKQDITDEVPTGFAGNGTIFDFNGLIAGIPIFPSTMSFRYTIGGTDFVGQDSDNGNGTGQLTGTNVNSTLSTIDYATGVVRVVFGTRPSITSGNAETYDLDALNSSGPVDLVYSIDGAADVTITFVSGDFSDYTMATAAEVAAKINATTAGFADGTSGRVVLTGSTIGSTGTIEIKAATVNPDANTALGFSTSQVTGDQDPPDAASVISFDYQSALRLVLLTAPVSGSDITISMESGPTLKQFPSNNVEVYTWSTGPDGELTTPGAALRDSLKTFLDQRRVLGTSVQVLPGLIVRVSYFLEVVFDAAVSQTETQNRIIEAIEALFADPVQVKAGQDVPLAAVYDAIFPLQGVVEPTVEEVAIRVPVGTGDGITAIFKQDPELDTPGRFINAGKLPGDVSESSTVKVYVDSAQVGLGTTGDPIVTLGTQTGAAFSMLTGSFFNSTNGEFDVRLTPSPAIGQVIALEYRLNREVGGTKLWNIDINEWEIAVLGEIHINGVQVRNAT